MMDNNQQFTFKIANEKEEFEQIHQLNYSTFVDEIPQHSQNPDQILIDKFHRENIYIICLSNTQELVGMICVRDKRPFSLDAKIKNIDDFLPKKEHVCEIRLLSVKKGFRNSKVFYGLSLKLNQFCKEKGYEMALISGTTTQLKLYKHLGFKQFADPVGTPEALFYPMYITVEDVLPFLNEHSIQQFINSNEIINLLPGPVQLDTRVVAEYTKCPVSHRSALFIADFQKLRLSLCNLVYAKYVEILSGSGTLANDAVAAHLSQNMGKGLILSNGEFGERLISQANRFNLNFISLKISWGSSFSYKELNEILDQNEEIKWIWAVHCETSTGVLNDMIMLKEVCLQRNIKLCLDCISTIGILPLNLNDVYLATCSSGKAICSFAGLSMVFYNHEINVSPDIPKYFDLGFYRSENGTPFTVLSNLVYALKKAVETIEDMDVTANSIKEKSKIVRDGLINSRFKIINDAQFSSPALVTIELDKEDNSIKLGEYLEHKNCFVNYRSGYLVKRNWLQIFITRNTTEETIHDFIKLLKHKFSCE